MFKNLSALFAAFGLLAAPALAQAPPQWTYSTQNGSPVAAYQGNVVILGTVNPTGGLTGSGLTGTTLTISGNGTIGGTLGVTGASTLAGMTATSGTFSGALASNTLSVTGGISSSSVSTSAVTSYTVGGTGTTTFVAGAAAGTGPTVACAASRLCDSYSGTIALTTGTTPPTGGILLTATFPTTRGTTPNCSITIKGVSGASYTDTETTSTFVLTDIVALGASTAYTVNYICGGV